MRLGFCAVGSLLLVLGGCSVSRDAAPVPDAGAAIRGSVRGGQQPINGMHVYLLSANTTGYGNASVSLLTSGTAGSDSVGGYVLSGSDGSFSITGDYSCTAGTQVYLYGLGGNPGAGVNASAGLMAALGDCGNLSSSTFVSMNEVSTVAAAYAMAGFATDATHVSSSGTALAKVGIANAFANAANLETLSTGNALATTPAGNGTAPQAEINTLADVLAACINSDGTIAGPTNATACYTLFNNALSGGATGSLPTDTATAAINIAHNPVANLAALFRLAGGTPPFQPTLAAVPADFALAVVFSGSVMPQVLNMGGPLMAIDAGGNVWFAGTSSVVKMSPTGVVLSGASGYTGGGMGGTTGLAIDPSGNVWVTGTTNTNVVKLDGTSGAILSGTNGYSGGGLTAPIGIAMDGSGDAWVVDHAAGIMVEMDPNGNVLSGASGIREGVPPLGVAVNNDGSIWEAAYIINPYYPSAGRFLYAQGQGATPLPTYVDPVAMAIDGSGNVVLNSRWPGGGGVGVYDFAKLTKTTAIVSTHISACTSPGLDSNQVDTECVGENGNPFALDGAGNVWAPIAFEKSQSGGGLPYVPSGYGLSEAATTPNPNPTGPIGLGSALNTPALAVAVDGSGNIWTQFGTTVAQYIGVATPVVTPFSLGVKNGTEGARP